MPRFKGKTHYRVTLDGDHAFVEVVSSPERDSDQMMISIEGADDREARALVTKAIKTVQGARTRVSWSGEGIDL